MASATDQIDFQGYRRAFCRPRAKEIWGGGDGAVALTVAMVDGVVCRSGVVGRAAPPRFVHMDFSRGVMY